MGKLSKLNFYQAKIILILRQISEKHDKMSSPNGKFFIQFDDNQQEQQQPKPSQTTYKTDSAAKRIDNHTDKYSVNKIGKGFFNEIDEQNFIEVTSPPKKSHQYQQTQANNATRQDRKRRSKKNQALTPLMHKTKLQTVPLNLPTQLEKQKYSKGNQKMFFVANEQEQQQIEEIGLGDKQEEKREEKCLFDLKKVVQDQQRISQQQDQIKGQFKRQKFKPLNVQVSGKQPKKLEFGSNSQDSPEFLKNNKSNAISPNQIKQFVTKNLPSQKTVRLTLHRIKGLLQFTSYNLHASQDNRYLLTAKKVSNSFISTHHISMSPNDMQENGPAYVGKVKSSITGTSHNIYGPGLSPENAKGNNGPQREILATVVYLTELFNSNSKPRQLRVYMKKPEVSYFQLSGVTPYQEQASLQDLYPLNKSKIAVFRNRKPVWKQQVKGYSLNFRGRVSQPSIKNFILETSIQQEEGQQVLLFGRVDSDRFNMDVSGPLNLSLALGIVVTSFGSA